jgi:hypothetical protein
MKKSLLALLIALLAITSTRDAALAQMVSLDDALTVAENWITVIVNKKGSWGGSDTAEVSDIVDFKRGNNRIGYFCQVDPQGYIIVSLRRELAPVKAYSASSSLDPESEEGLADLIKSNMEKLLAKIQLIRSMSAFADPNGLLPTEVEIDYRSAWDVLQDDVQRFMDTSAKSTAPITPKASTEAGGNEEDLELSTGEMANYVEGNALLTSHWHQFPPYNNFCPDMSCTNTSNNNAVVGCVATAGAQIMRYWNWPPYGAGSSIGGVSYTDTYDWVNMPDTATTASSAAVQNAVAEISYEIGVAVGMDYGCDGSSAYTYDMEGVFENRYRYSNVYKRDRSDYTATAWFDLMKDEFNFNRPVQYKIPGHSIVGDGWQEVGSPVVRQYHMVYGWTSAAWDTWYTLDALQGGDPSDEYLLENIRPEPYLIALDGTFNRDAAFPYRYFYRDTWGSNGTFAGGQRIQFLPDIVVSHNGAAGTVTFQGSASYFSYLFTRGELNRGIKIHLNSTAGVRLYSNGAIRFH